jgi:hypothetical protein
MIMGHGKAMVMVIGNGYGYGQSGHGYGYGQNGYGYGQNGYGYGQSVHCSGALQQLSDPYTKILGIGSLYPDAQSLFSDCQS